jgi:hypothetical protein
MCFWTYREQGNLSVELNSVDIIDICVLGAQVRILCMCVCVNLESVIV